jgi:hypothetical protein
MAVLCNEPSSKSPDLPEQQDLEAPLDPPLLAKNPNELPPEKGTPLSQRVPDIYPDLEELSRMLLSPALLTPYPGETHSKTGGKSGPGMGLFPLQVLPVGSLDVSKSMFPSD